MAINGCAAGTGGEPGAGEKVQTTGGARTVRCPPRSPPRSEDLQPAAQVDKIFITQYSGQSDAEHFMVFRL